MIVICGKCNLSYDDLDHWTTCPHDYFSDPKEPVWQPMCWHKPSMEWVAIAGPRSLLDAWQVIDRASTTGANGLPKDINQYKVVPIDSKANSVV